ncbi:hypothetical protein K505DRAFT_419452 [Melanomma pulvis-pyrius CBS 109.77]|uniref:Protein kinase domain-containing protein n=1 Tax=Melanomma pulvis-pyrius CBS 109.77 TaxID=1314802 RepID=A0A6A6X3S5_9PLEO|nr:hypothetical protein K505DRAFT_419452 [Melanomma pulvis-pyrius CBS 109.77]
MARTRLLVRLKPSTTNERPEPISSRQPGFDADLDLIEATQIDEDSVILVPDVYIDEPDDSLEAIWRDEYSASRCWKTTAIYEQIGENHPHVVSFKRRDPWTALPVLAKPSGPPVTKFITEHRSTMYSAPLDAPTSRILPSHRPLAYQWALHIISGLTFVHSHDVIFGDLNLIHCWLSSDSHLSLSLVGFVNAGFNYVERWSHIIHGDRTNGNNFHPLEHQANPTKQTDLFLYGCTVYELMTGFWPATRSGIPTWREIAAMVPRKEWPLLEAECMGEIVRKCWNGEYASAEEVKASVVAFLGGLGWEIEGDDDLKGFNATDLFSQ